MRRRGGQTILGVGAIRKYMMMLEFLPDEVSDLLDDAGGVRHTEENFC